MHEHVETACICLVLSQCVKDVRLLTAALKMVRQTLNLSCGAVLFLRTSGSRYDWYFGGWGVRSGKGGKGRVAPE